MIDKLRSKIYNILRKSEKFFQTDMIYLAKGGFWLTLGQIVSSLSSFLLAIAFANLLPKETYGTYKYVLSLVGMLSIFTLSGMNTSLTRSVARGFEGSLKPILKEKIKWGSIGSLVSLGIAVYYYLNGNLTLTICFVITAVFLPLMDPLDIYTSFLSGRKKFKLKTKYLIISKIIATILIILVLILSKNIFLLLFTYFISYTLCRFIFFKLTIKKEKPNSEKELGTISYGKHLSLMNVINIIAMQIDKILVFHFLGAGELAIYSIAIAPPEQIKGLLKNVKSLALPKYAKKSILEIKKTFFKKIIRFTLITSVIIIFYIILAPLIYKTFFPKYLESIFYSQIFIVSLLFISSTLLSITILESHSQVKKLYKINIISAIIRILSTIYGLYFYGLLGLIIANLLYQFIYSILLILILKTHFLNADTK